MNKSSSSLKYFIIYNLIIIAQTLFSLFPEGRVFAFNLWGYLPSYLIISIGLLLIIVGYVLYRKESQLQNYFQNNISDKNFILTGSILIILFGLLFVVFKAKTFFLGDGSTLLALLVDENPMFIKYRNLGEALSHLWLYNLLGKGGEATAVLSYQVISIFSGILFVAASFIFSKKYYENNLERILLFVGLLTSGSMLLYFGYVENYSIFNLIVSLFLFTSLLSLRFPKLKWASFLLWGSSIFFHVFGIVLFPIIVYLLLADSSIGNKLKNLKKQNKILLAFLLSVSAILLFLYLYSNEFFFRISLVPLIAEKYTPDGYSMFSLDHLIDFGQLLLILSPGILFAASLLFNRSMITENKPHEFRFLVVAVVTTLIAAFWIDPKLGMARDWDLFAFSALPLTILILSTFINKKSYLPLLLTILLGFVFLFSRVAIVNSPKRSIEHFKNQIFTDKTKNGNGLIILIRYYRDNLEIPSSDKYSRLYDELYPENRIVIEAESTYVHTRDISKSMTLVKSALEHNPAYPDAYGYLGFLWLESMNLDSALYNLKLSDALSPNRSNVLNNIGQAYLKKQNYELAEKYYLKAYLLDTASYTYNSNIGWLFKQTNEIDKEINHLQRAIKTGEAPPELFYELIEKYLLSNTPQKAQLLYDKHQFIKEDTMFVNFLNQKYNFSFENK